MVTLLSEMCQLKFESIGREYMDLCYIIVKKIKSTIAEKAILNFEVLLKKKRFLWETRPIV